MKKILFVLVCAFAVLSASAQDKKLTLNAGFLFPNTLNAMIGYEHPLSYGNAVEIYGEVGNHWQKPTCCRFWKGYYWDGGLVYKQRLVRYKNGILRFRLGPQFGATQKKFFLGVEAGFEYSYVFQNGWEFSLIQKNNVNFLHGDTFRNGLLLGVKIPFLVFTQSDGLWHSKKPGTATDVQLLPQLHLHLSHHRDCDESSHYSG